MTLEAWAPLSYDHRVLRQMIARALIALALLSMLAVSVMPIATRVMGTGVAPDEIKIVGLLNGDSHYCVVTSVCATVTPSSTGMDFTPTEQHLFLACFTFVVLVTIVSVRRTLAPASATPPPRPVYI
ncbi:MAG TPA: hypothetical protein VH951_01650 [Dehalococcoidia bacterium]